MDGSLKLSAYHRGGCPGVGSASLALPALGRNPFYAMAYWRIRRESAEKVLFI